jgi:transposase
MAYLTPQDRLQLQMRSMEECISKDNPVRFVDAFLEQLELPKLGFVVPGVKTEGRPAFNPKVFVKLYLYGYLNGLRSSRKLEKEAVRNVEVHWLLGSLMPNYHSIADFRKENPKALKSTFKLFVLFLKEADLITGEVVAMDGTKVSKGQQQQEEQLQRQEDRTQRICRSGGEKRA